MSRKKLLSSSTTTAATATASKHRRLERRLFFRSCHLPFYSRTLFSVPTAATAGASAGASVVGAAASATGGAAAMTTSSAVIGRRRWRKKKKMGEVWSLGLGLFCCPRSLVRERATDVLAHARRGGGGRSATRDAPNEGRAMGWTRRRKKRGEREREEQLR